MVQGHYNTVLLIASALLSQLCRYVTLMFFASAINRVSSLHVSLDSYAHT